MAKRLILIIALVTEMASVAQCSVRYHSCLLWNLNTLDTIGTETRRSIVWYGDKIIKEDYISVTNKQRSMTGDVHDYESTATYYWPDPQDPVGKYIVKDGQKNPECDLFCVQLIYELSDRLKNLGKAYYVTGDKMYAIWALKQIKTWFLEADTYMKPDFEYGQVIPGGSYKKGNVGAISEAYYLIDALEMISMLKDAGLLDNKTDRALKKWFKEFAVWMTTSNIGTKMQAVEDNCGTMYDILLYRISFYVGDKKRCKQILREFASRRINSQIEENGSQPRELKRVNAMDYSLYNLQHILDFCEMMERTGSHYYRVNNSRIDNAIEFLRPYVENQKSFPYKESGNWQSLVSRFSTIQKRIASLR